MKEKIEAKINDVIEHILHKPTCRITINDYAMLQDRLCEIRNRETQEDNGKRMAELLAMAFPGASAAGLQSER